MSDERELEREAEALRAAYRKLPRAEPPPALDRAVLAQARAALAKPEAARRPRWLLPVGLAATAVLAIGVAWRMDKQPEDRWPSRPATPAAEQPAAPPPAARVNAPADGPAPDTNESDEKRNESDEKRKLEEAAGLEQKSDLGQFRDEDTAGKRAPATEGELKKTQPAVAPKLRELRPQAPPPPAATPAPIVQPEMVLESAPAPKPAQEPFPGRDDAAQAKEEASETEREAPKQPASPAPVDGFDKLDAARSAPAKDGPSGQTLAAPAPAGVRRQKQLELQGTGTRASPQSKSAATVEAQGGAAGSSRPELRNRAAGVAQASITDADREQPDTWLDAIRRVLSQGDEAQARHELRAFQRRHPGYPVPDDLARLFE